MKSLENVKRSVELPLILDVFIKIRTYHQKEIILLKKCGHYFLTRYK